MGDNRLEACLHRTVHLSDLAGERPARVPTASTPCRR
jgi:hypothetical protein